LIQRDDVCFARRPTHSIFMIHVVVPSNKPYALSELGDVLPDVPFVGENQYDAALNSDYLRRAKARSLKSQPKKEEESEVVTTTTDDTTWKNINDSLVQARNEVEQAAQLVDVLRDRIAVAEPVQIPAPTTASLIKQRRIALQSKADELQRAAGRVYTRVGRLGEQLSADVGFFAQLESLAQLWRVELPKGDGSLCFDYAPMFTANYHASVAQERALSVFAFAIASLAVA
jgi:hypothetical protein